MADRPKLGLILPTHGASAVHALAVARAAEAAGLDAVWVPDHLLNLAHPRAGVLECWSVLAAVAGATRRIGLGTLVLTTSFRPISLLAKQAATVEALAPGRLCLGLGAGGFTYEASCGQFGVERLSPADRVAHVEETVRCLRALWSEDPASFEGRFARVRELRIHPRPARPIPIVLAAGRPRMLALTARLADGWNCPLPQELAAGLAALERHGRERASIDVSAFAIAVVGETEAAARRALERAGPSAQRFGDVESHHVFGDPDRAAARIGELARLGAAHVALDVRGAPHEEVIELLVREIAPRL